MRQLVVIAILVLLLPAAALAEDYEIAVELSQDTIGMDEQAILAITVSGSSRDLPRPTLPVFPAFELLNSGSRSNMRIVNGATTTSNTYLFALIPRQAGSYVISGIAVGRGNQRSIAEPVTITVLTQGSTVDNSTAEAGRDATGQARDYWLEADVSTKTPYVNQQVTLTIRYYRAVRQLGSPDLTHPTTTGFWREYLGNKPPTYQQINGRRYHVLEVNYALFPTITGKLTIGRAALSVNLATRRGQRNSVLGLFGGGQQVTLRTQPIVVDVRPLPTAGKPVDFTGSVGNYSLSASANKTTAEVNEPISVTFQIQGSGNIKAVADPILPEVDGFQVHRESTDESVTNLNEQVGGSRTVNEVFIPRRPGVLTIPAARFNFFDPRDGRYREIASQPIDITVSEPEGWAQFDDGGYATPNTAVGGEMSDIRFIKTEPGRLRPTGGILLTNPVYIAVNALPVLALIGLIAWRAREERLRADVGRSRSRSAGKAARRRLAEARRLSEQDDYLAFYAELSRAVVAYIADTANVSPHGLSQDDVAALLTNRGVAEDLVADVRGLLQSCDFARFAPQAGAVQNRQSALNDAEVVINRLEELRRA